MGGQNYQRNSGVDLLKSRQQIESISVRQRVIENRGIRRRSSKCFLSLGEGLGFFDLEVVALQETSDAEPDSGFVVDE